MKFMNGRCSIDLISLPCNEDSSSAKALNDLRATNVSEATVERVCA